jgi:hypothetical protein
MKDDPDHPARLVSWAAQDYQLLLILGYNANLLRFWVILPHRFGQKRQRSVPSKGEKQQLLKRQDPQRTGYHHPYNVSNKACHFQIKHKGHNNNVTTVKMPSTN